MRTTVLALALLLVAGCSAEPGADDSATTPATATPTPAAPAPASDPAAPPPAHTPPPDDGTPSPDAGSNTVASRFQGRYAADAAACANPAHETRLTIEASRIAFHESSGPITRVAQGESEVSITTALTGEGQTREATYSFRLSADGNTLTDVGNGIARQRCD
ncbi:hypothetical protein ACFQZQ_04010 [Lysobacter koreensis]|uniref:Lipoprotein n=1 Tax=Lysobacter koreensis TaxID=266122 RepID=A0ABW2YK24_9GAMM